MTLLEVNNLSKSFSDKKVIDAVNFSITENECIALIGPNGAGKSTIIKMIAQLLKPTQGTIALNRNFSSDFIRANIGYLPQHPAFYNWMTGKEFLTYAGKLGKVPKEKLISEVKRLLQVTGIEADKDKLISTYSGGMKQRLGIAQAIIHKPRLLILDEPVSALDPQGRRDILNLMKQLKSEMTILFSTHILNDAEEVSDSLLFLSHGKLIEAGSLLDLKSKYATTAIEVAFNNQSTDLTEKLIELVGVVNVQRENITYTIATSDQDIARDSLLQFILAENLVLTYFNMASVSLEQMFMEVVSK